MKYWGALVTLFCLLAGFCSAGVNLKNGNFYISYTDIIAGKLEIKRTYNSRSIRHGWFGFGWGSDYETYLQILPEGAVYVHHNGSGRQDYCVPIDSTGSDVAASVDQIVEAARIHRAELTPDDESWLRQSLLNDAELRSIYFRDYHRLGLLPAYDVEVGTVLASAAFAGQRITRTELGYKLEEGRRGKTLRFDSAGRLLEIFDPSTGSRTRLRYEGRAIEISDGSHSILLRRDGKNRVFSAQSGDALATYRYNIAGDLIYSRDAGNNVFQYSYDSNHNMTEILYADGRTRKVTYTPRTQFVSRIKRKDNTTWHYTYSDKSEMEYDTWVGSASADGELHKRSNYHYSLKVTPKGQAFTGAIVSRANGVVVRKEYNADGFVTLNSKAKIERKFDSANRFTFERHDEAEFRLDYEPNSDNLASCLQITGGVSELTQFSYDKKGQVKSCKTSDGLEIVLARNDQQQIETAERSDGQKARLKYDEHGRLSTVELSGPISATLVARYRSDHSTDLLDFANLQGVRISPRIEKQYFSLWEPFRPRALKGNYKCPTCNIDHSVVGNSDLLRAPYLGQNYGD